MMEKKFADVLVEAAEVMGASLDVRDDYSGRGMFGNSTFAVTGDGSEFLAIVAYAGGMIGQDREENGHLDLDEFVDAMRSLRSDSMGRSDTVWY